MHELEQEENLIMTLPNLLRLSMLGTLIALTNGIIHIPLRLPGHTGIQWMALLLLGKGLIPQFGSGMIMGVISGALAVFLGLGNEGVFVFFKYFFPGFLLDLLAPSFFNRLDHPVVGGMIGAIASFSKLVVSMGLALLLQLPMNFLYMGIGFVSGFHLFFGAVGGMIASFLIKRLRPILHHIAEEKGEIG